MSKVAAALRSVWVRGAFVLFAVVAASVTVAGQWDAIVPAVRSMPIGVVGAALLAGLIYLPLTMLAWRAILSDLGTSLRFRDAFGVFFASQLGKYVPGGVWNLIAASELGADRKIPRRRSLSAMVVTLLVSIVSGLAVAAPAVAMSAGGADRRYLAVWALLPLSLALLTPPVLNRLLTLAMRVARREPLEHPLTARGTLAAVAWSVSAWLVVGAQVWALGLGLGMKPGIESYVLSAGAYALAWIVVFVVVVVPAGLGARELVLAALLSGKVDDDAVIVIVLLTRIVQTLVDLSLGAVGLALTRRRTGSPTGVDE
jgi:uncharacterized membrane protein YbhN (UPF0104 family)